MPRRGPLRSAWLGVLLGLALACRPSGGDDGTGTGGEESGATASDTGEIPDPAFLNPALGEFVVESTQHVPKDIVVQAIALGNTELFVDDRSAGTLAAGSTLGELTGARLRIFLHGALTLGTHTLQLVSSAPDGPRFSARLTMIVGGPAAGPPALRVDFAAEPLDVGDALITGGAGPDALLGVLTAGPDPTLRLRLGEAGGWTAEPVVEATLVGHVPQSMAFGPAVFARAVAPRPGSDVASVRIAYRRGLPGDAILTRDLTFAPEPAGGPLETAVDVSAPLFADAEFAALGRPFLLDDTVIAEFLAADDSETPHPGDRGLALVRRRPDGAGWAAPVRVSTPEQIDLDAVGPALELPLLRRSSALSVRIGQRLAGLLTLSDAGAALLSVPVDELALSPGDPCVLTTIVTSLGGRTVAAGTRDHGFGLAFLGTSGRPKSAAAVVAADELPDAPVTAPPAAGVVLGFSTFLLPFDDAAPVHVVFGDGSRTYVAPLASPEPIHCRAVALLPGLGGNDDAAPALPFACLTGGVLRVGVLAVEVAAP